jgi:hypothetical protein
LEYAEKRYRALQKPNWNTEEKLFCELGEGLLQLADLYVTEGSQDSIYNARSKIRSALKQAEDCFSGHTIYKELENKLDNVNTLLK